jgi:hypothetical protein
VEGTDSSIHSIHGPRTDEPSFSHVTCVRFLARGLVHKHSMYSRTHAPIHTHAKQTQWHRNTRIQHTQSHTHSHTRTLKSAQRAGTLLFSLNEEVLFAHSAAPDGNGGAGGNGGGNGGGGDGDGSVLVRDSPRLPSKDEGSRYFCNWRESMWSLLILITSANFPDVMMPVGVGRCR